MRYVHFGEGDYDETEAAIRACSREAGARRLGGVARGRRVETAEQATPETYLGLRARRGLGTRRAGDGTRTYNARGRRPPLRATSRSAARWKIDDESAGAVRDARARRAA